MFQIHSTTPGDTGFIEKLVNFDRDNISDRVLKKIGTYCSQADFHPDIVGRVSGAAKSLCMWARAMEIYGRIFRVVEPKKQRLANATAQLNEKQRTLSEAKAKLKEVTDKIETLKKNYDEKLAQKEELGNRANMLELKLERAGKLVSGLGGERERWEASVEVKCTLYLFILFSFESFKVLFIILILYLYKFIQIRKFILFSMDEV